MKDVSSDTLFVGNMYIKDRVYLPLDSSELFKGFSGNLVNANMLDASHANNMREMFAYAHTPASIDVSNWNVSKVSSMNSMFLNAERINPNTSKWDVSNVEDMGAMFQNSMISQADMSHWNTKSLKSSDYMFNSCNNLRYIKTPEGFKSNAT